MKQKAAVLVGVPLLIGVAVAVPLGLWRGEYQWACAGIAAALTVLPGLLTLFAVEWLARRSPYGRVAGMALGIFVRLVIGFGGAAAVFWLSKPTFHTNPVSYWGWVLGMYLITLMVETALLSQESLRDSATKTGGQPQSG